MRYFPALRNARWQRPVRILLTACWVVAVAFGFSRLERFDRTPGVEASAPSTWPEATALSMDDDRLNVVVALHPRCPCSKATLEVLGAMAEQHPSAARFHFLVFRPAGGVESWHETGLWRDAQRFQGARFLLDDNGSEAARFGAVSSGTVAVYAAKGRLLFKGGITPSRGSVGPNRGADILARLMTYDGKPLAEQVDPPSCCPVYGCSLVPEVTFRPDAIPVRL